MSCAEGSLWDVEAYGAVEVLWDDFVDAGALHAREALEKVSDFVLFLLLVEWSVADDL